MRKKIYLFMFLFIIFLTRVSASTCSDERLIELTSKATNVKVSYEYYNDADGSFYNENFETETVEYKPSFYIAIFNLADDLNAFVTSNTSGKGVMVTSEDAEDDGVVYIDTGAANKVKTYTVKIRSNDSNCQNEVLIPANVVTVPMVNRFFQTEACQDNPDFDMCKEFVSTDYNSITERDFQEKFTKYVENKKEEEKKEASVLYKIGNFFKTYALYLIIIVVLIIGIVTFYFVKRKEKRLE